MKIFPYNQLSRSVSSLKKALNIKAIKREGSKYKDKPTDIILNWGCSAVPFTKAKIINDPAAVKLASNKLLAFPLLANPVPFTSNIELAKEWINDKKTVFCRTILSGHSGAGIVVAEQLDQLVPCDLYTQYIKKVSEYRVHIFCGKVILVQEKKRKKGAETNSKIRNHQNGWVFCTDGVTIGEEGKQLAITSITNLGLDFGAVDIIYNEHYKKYYVLEVNTAPGLEGNTINCYKDAINENYPL